ncbi:MAG: hypothetical protein P1V97_32815 [Planctomycetota bacterium]|nr:hypothetical protein [Planctomycetota bacterium]
MRSRGPNLIHDNDFPAIEDKLGFGKSAQNLAKFIERLDAPYSLHLDGPAGSGRTSFLRFVAKHLDASPALTPLWIDAPSIDEHGSILCALISKLSRFKQSPELDELSLRFLSLYSLYSEQTGLTPTLDHSVEDMDRVRQSVELMTRPEPQGMNLFASVENLQDTFLHFVQASLAPNGSRFFLAFIDDLDICKAETIDRFLAEAFLYTSIPGSRVVWIFTLNQSQYEQRQAAAAQDHLRKFTNLKIRVPITQSPRSLINQYVTDLGLPEAKGLINQFNDLFEAVPVKNPRLIKRIVSRISYAKTFGSMPRPSQEQLLFYVLVLISELFPRFFSAIAKDKTAGLLVLSAAGNSYGQSKFNATTFEPMLKPIKTKFEEELQSELFYTAIGYAGMLVGKVYGIRTGNVNEAVPRFAPVLNSVLQLF